MTKIKVRMSQIPEESGKPQYEKKKTKTTEKPVGSYDDEDDDDFFGIDDDDVEDEVKRIKKTVVLFEDEGIVISAYDLHTIEKDMRFVETPKAHWEFGITINKGLSSNQFVTKTDISLWYMNEEFRDEKWKRLIELLQMEGLSVINV